MDAFTLLGGIGLFLLGMVVVLEYGSILRRICSQAARRSLFRKAKIIHKISTHSRPIQASAKP